MSVITAIIKCNGTELDLPHILLGIDVNWEVNRIPYAQLILVEGSSATRKFPLSDAAVFSPGNTVEILLREEGKQGITTSIFKGLVVRHALESEGVESVLRVELKDSAYKMTIARKSAVHQGTDKDILTKLIKAANLDADIEGGSDLTHPEMVQYYCTDWDFMLSRAEAQNLVVAVRDGKVSARPLMVKALYDNSRTHSFMYGIDPMYRFEMEADAENQYGEIESNFWIYNNGTKKGESMSTEKPNTNSFLDDDNLGAEEIKKSKPSSDGEKISLTSAVPMDSQEAKSWADSRVARSYMSLLRGSISVPGIADIMLLDLMEIAGLGNRFKGKTLVTGFRHQVDENGWQTHVQFGLPAEPFAQSPNILDAPAAGLLPAVHGLQPGIVEAFKEDSDNPGNPDKQFRVRIKLPGIDPATGSVWARLAMPHAGNERGLLFHPEEGDEVVVGFYNNDPRHPVILGCLYSSTNKPPQPKGWEKWTAENISKGFVSKSGIIIGINDKDKILTLLTSEKQHIILDETKNTIEILDVHENKITLSEKGIFLKTTKDVKIKGKNIRLKATANVEIEGKGKVELK